MPAPATLIGSLDLTQPIRWGCPVIAEPADGWDTMTEKLLLPDAGFLAKGTQRPTPAGMVGKFFVQDVQITEWVAGYPLADVVSHGLANNKPAKWTAQGLTNEDPRLIFGLFATVWRDQYPRVTKRWISNLRPKIKDHVGISDVPYGHTYGLPALPWYKIQVGSEWDAYGWVGESRVIDELVGCDYCFVTDTWLLDLGYDRTDQTDAYYVGA